MGCGGSKEGVAAGNTTVIPRRLLRRKSQSSSEAHTSFAAAVPDATLTNTFDDKSTSVEAAAIDNNTDETPALATVVKTAVATPNDVAAEEDGKLITEESADEYFSSRKDAEVVSEVVVGAEYYSPERQTDNEGAKDEKSDALGEREPESSVDNVEALHEEKASAVGEEAIVAPEEDAGILLSKDSADFKETILVEETRMESDITERTSIGEGDVIESK